MQAGADLAEFTFWLPNKPQQYWHTVTQWLRHSASSFPYPSALSASTWNVKLEQRGRDHRVTDRDRLRESVCVGVCVRERQTDRQTDRQRERQREILWTGVGSSISSEDTFMIRLLTHVGGGIHIYLLHMLLVYGEWQSFIRIHNRQMAGGRNWRWWW